MSVPADWKLAETVLGAWNHESMEAETKRAILYGPPGTGKTWAARHGSEDSLTLECSEEMSVADIIGHYIPVGHRFIWQLKAAPLAMMQGRRLVIDEADKLSGPCWDILRHITAMDDVACLTLPDPTLSGTDEEIAAAIVAGDGLIEIRPVPGYAVVMTMNGDPADLEEPIQDRFPVQLHITNIHPDALNALPEDLRPAAQRTAANTDPDRRVGIRAWHTFANLRVAIGDEDTAAKAVFGKRYGDAMDALRLARATMPKPEPEPTKPEPEREPCGDEHKHDERLPRSYWRVSRKPGKPGQVRCDLHGKLTMKTADERSDGLYCRRCDEKAAERDGYKVRVLRDGGWVCRVCGEPTRCSCDASMEA